VNILTVTVTFSFQKPSR